MAAHTMKVLSLCRRISRVIYELASLSTQLEVIRWELSKVQEDIDELRMLVENQGVSRVAKDKKLAERHEAEFKVFSQ